MQKKQYFCTQIYIAYCGPMTIAIFGNAMKTQTLTEVRHILNFMTEKGIHVLLSQELRQELNLREYPGFPENWDGDQQPENVYGARSICRLMSVLRLWLRPSTETMYES